MKKFLSAAIACMLVCQFTIGNAAAANEKQIDLSLDKVAEITRKQNRTIKVWKHRIDAIENSELIDNIDESAEAAEALKEAQDLLKDAVENTSGIDADADITLGAFYIKVNTFCIQNPAIGLPYSALSSMQQTNALMEALVHFGVMEDPANFLDPTEAAQKQQELQQLAANYQQRFTGKESTYENADYWLVQSIEVNTTAIEEILKELQKLDIKWAANDTVDLANTYIAEMEDRTAQGAETLFLAICKLEEQSAILREKQEYISFSISCAKAKYNAGMMTKAELMTLESKLPEVENGIEILNHTINVLRKNLAVLMGYESETNLSLKTPEDSYITTISEINFAADKEKAKKSNHAIKQAKQSKINADYRSDDMYDAATIAQKEAEEQFEVDFKATYDTLTDAYKAYTLQKIKFDAEKEVFRVMELSYEVGLKSGLEYRTAKDTFAESELALEQARLSLIESRRAYDWALSGLTTNSLNSVQN